MSAQTDYGFSFIDPKTEVLVQVTGFKTKAHRDQVMEDTLMELPWQVSLSAEAIENVLQ